MTNPLLRLSRKGLLLLGVFALMSLVGPVAPTKPALAYCEPEQCLWDPPMHWSCGYNACVCDCPRDFLGDPTDISNCGPCV
jgi:hypothetical protein